MSTKVKGLLIAGAIILISVFGLMAHFFLPKSRYLNKPPEKPEKIIKQLLHENDSYKIVPATEGIDSENIDLAFAEPNTIKIEDNSILQRQETSLALTKNNETIWQSDEGWIINSFLESDLNCDGKNEITFLLNKTEDMTRWNFEFIKKIGAGFDSFIYLYDFTVDPPQPIWKSSALSRNVSSIKSFDIDNDGCEELITIERPKVENEDKEFVFTGSLNILEWNGFGFTKEWESEESDYETYHVQNNRFLVLQ